MASLRKRPADAATTDEKPDEVAIGVETGAPEAPEAPEASTPDHAGEALRRQIEALSQAKSMEQQTAIVQLAANERRQAWLASTPGALENRNALGKFHHEALQAGLADTSPQYFRFMEDQLAALQAPHPAVHVADEMRQRVAQQEAPQPPPAKEPRVVTAAPVSRSVPNASGKRHQSPGRITLTAAEVEAARISGISVEEYAKMKIRKSQMIASGEYGEQPR